MKKLWLKILSLMVYPFAYPGETILFLVVIGGIALFLTMFVHGSQVMLNLEAYGASSDDVTNLSKWSNYCVFVFIMSAEVAAITLFVVLLRALYYLQKDLWINLFGSFWRRLINFCEKAHRVQEWAQKLHGKLANEIYSLTEDRS